MSECIRCDNCGQVESAAADEIQEWIHIEWGWGRARRTDAHVCTAACAVALIETARDQDATEALALLDEPDDGDAP